ncbi:hypothetical protein [Streptomyces albidoflavus]|uniref:hypothetical protein n=1 Tax=Streptomyces albidoflavus TaxID=1886 RepID=UPI001020F92F|nr:hypothetical protein [Streptomyces albidoflavus]RZF05983.1 hypothetical protein C0R05_24430 [Streptomyces albidoflavus]
MNIEVKVDEITLSTVVADVLGIDEDGETYTDGQRTIADLVAAQIVTRLTRSTEWPTLRQRFLDIRNEEIRAAVRPSIEDAINRPIYRTNHYGERTGEQTTLAEVIADEARQLLKEPADRYRSERGTVLQQVVRAEVKKAFETEIADMVKQARDLVTTQLGDDIARQVTAAVTAGLAKR